MSWGLFGILFYLLIIACLRVFHSILVIKYDSGKKKLKLFAYLTIHGWIVISGALWLIETAALYYYFLIATTVLIWLFELVFLFASRRLQNYVVLKVSFQKKYFTIIDKYFFIVSWVLTAIGGIVFIELFSTLYLRGK